MRRSIIVLLLSAGILTTQQFSSATIRQQAGQASSESPTSGLQNGNVTLDALSSNEVAFVDVFNTNVRQARDFAAVAEVEIALAFRQTNPTASFEEFRGEMRLATDRVLPFLQGKESRAMMATRTVEQVTKDIIGLFPSSGKYADLGKAVAERAVTYAGELRRTQQRNSGNAAAQSFRLRAEYDSPQYVQHVARDLHKRAMQDPVLRQYYASNAGLRVGAVVGRPAAEQYANAPNAESLKNSRLLVKQNGQIEATVGELRDFTNEIAANTQAAVEAIAAEQRASKIDEEKIRLRNLQLDAARSGAFVFSTLIGTTDPIAAQRFSTVSNASIRLVEVFSQYSANRDISSGLATAALGGNMLSIGLAVAQAWAPQQESSDQLLMKQLQAVSQQIATMHKAMDAHFRRVDLQLWQLSEQLSRGFDLANLKLDRIQETSNRVLSELAVVRDRLERSHLATIDAVVDLRSTLISSPLSLCVDLRRILQSDVKIPDQQILDCFIAATRVLTDDSPIPAPFRLAVNGSDRSALFDALRLAPENAAFNLPILVALLQAENLISISNTPDPEHWIEGTDLLSRLLFDFPDARTRIINVPETLRIANARQQAIRGSVGRIALPDILDAILARYEEQLIALQSGAEKTIEKVFREWIKTRAVVAADKLETTADIVESKDVAPLWPRVTVPEAFRLNEPLFRELAALNLGRPRYQYRLSYSDVQAWVASGQTYCEGRMHVVLEAYWNDKLVDQVDWVSERALDTGSGAEGSHLKPASGFTYCKPISNCLIEPVSCHFVAYRKETADWLPKNMDAALNAWAVGAKKSKTYQDASNQLALELRARTLQHRTQLVSQVRSALAAEFASVASTPEIPIGLNARAADYYARIAWALANYSLHPELVKNDGLRGRFVGEGDGLHRLEALQQRYVEWALEPRIQNQQKRDEEWRAALLKRLKLTADKDGLPAVWESTANGSLSASVWLDPSQAVRSDGLRRITQTRNILKSQWSSFEKGYLSTLQAAGAQLDLLRQTYDPSYRPLQ